MLSSFAPTSFVLTIQRTFIHVEPTSAAAETTAAVRSCSAPCRIPREWHLISPGRSAPAGETVQALGRLGQLHDESSSETEAWDAPQFGDAASSIAPSDARCRRARGRARPCKGKRDKFRKWCETLEQEVSEDPFSIDLRQLSMPPFFRDERKWQKVMARLERLRASAMSKSDF